MLPPNLTRHFWETRREYLVRAGLTTTGGPATTPWFQLTADERLHAETELDLFREAIRAAEKEQDDIAARTADLYEPWTFNGISYGLGRTPSTSPAKDQPPKSWQTTSPSRPAATETPRQDKQRPPGERLNFEIVVRPPGSVNPISAEGPEAYCSCPGCSAVATFLRLVGNRKPLERLLFGPPKPNPSDENLKTFKAKPSRTNEASNKPTPPVESFEEALARVWPTMAEDLAARRSPVPLTLGFDYGYVSADSLTREVRDMVATDQLRTRWWPPLSGV